jgi:hypothetical protein
LIGKMARCVSSATKNIRSENFLRPNLWRTAPTTSVSESL